jgi:hypothetical protein
VVQPLLRQGAEPQRHPAHRGPRLARYRRTQLAMIFQFFNSMEDPTVADNVLPAQLTGVPRRTPVTESRPAGIRSRSGRFLGCRRSQAGGAVLPYRLGMARTRPAPEDAAIARQMLLGGWPAAPG